MAPADDTTAPVPEAAAAPADAAAADAAGAPADADADADAAADAAATPAPTSCLDMGFEVHAVGTRSPWNLTLAGDELRIASRTDAAVVAVDRAHAPSHLRLHHGFLMKHTLSITKPKRAMFSTDPDAFAAVLDWLGPVATPLLRRELLRRLLPLAIIAIVSSQSSPLGIWLALPLVAPLLVTRLLGLAVPHALQFANTALLGVVIVGLEAFTLHEGAGWWHWMQLVVGATLVASELRAIALFSRLRAGTPIARTLAIALLVAGIAGTAVVAALHPFAAGTAVAGVYEARALGVRMTFPDGWRDAGPQAPVDAPAPENVRAQLFFDGRTLDGARAVLQAFAITGTTFEPEAFDEHGVEMAKTIVTEFASSIRPDGGDFTTCERVELRGRPIAHCRGRIPSAKGELHLSSLLVANAARTSMVALVMVGNGSPRTDEALAIAGSLEFLDGQ